MPLLLLVVLVLVLLPLQAAMERCLVCDKYRVARPQLTHVPVLLRPPVERLPVVSGLYGPPLCSPSRDVVTRPRSPAEGTSSESSHAP